MNKIKYCCDYINKLLGLKRNIEEKDSNTSSPEATSTASSEWFSQRTIFADEPSSPVYLPSPKPAEGPDLFSTISKYQANHTDDPATGSVKSVSSSINNMQDNISVLFPDAGLSMSDSGTDGFVLVDFN